MYLELVEGGWVMELPDGKVDMVLNLSVFPEEKTNKQKNNKPKQKKILKLCIQKHKKRTIKEERAQQKHGAGPAF